MQYHPATKTVASPQRTTVEVRRRDITPNQSKPALVCVFSKNTGSDAILTPVLRSHLGVYTDGQGELLNPHLREMLTHF